MTTDDIKQALIAPLEADRFKPSEYLSTGSTLLNLALSDNWQGGFMPGNYYFFVGDSSSGKTFFTQTCFAEACQNPFYDDYDLLFYDIEHGALMDRARFFGQRAAERVKPITHISALDDFYFDFYDRLTKPVIAVVDSMDAFTSRAEADKFVKNKGKAAKGKELAGDYGDGKAKINSRNARTVLGKIIETNSILIIVGQTRDNIGAEYWEPDQVFAGGHALKFYAAAQIWSKCGAKLSKSYRDHKIELGITSKVRVDKNRLTGKRREISVPIFHSSGIDDVGSMVEYLIDWKRWKTATGGWVEANELGLRLQKEKLIKKIEEAALEDEVRDLVWDTWQAIEKACEVPRKNRYL